MNRIPGIIKNHPGIILLLTGMAILFIFFRYPIEIVDALTYEPVPGFDIHISLWRVLFEPFIGPLLFYLRANKPAGEFSILFLWIIVLALAILLARSIQSRNKMEGRMKLTGFYSWLKAVPMITCIWLGLLWLIIYIPLPANTIVNHNDDTILINTHSHTEYSHDGIITTRGLQQWHDMNGYDAFFLTDHNHHQKSLEAVEAQNKGKFPQKPLMICGEEFSGGNHMTLLGLNKDFVTRGMTDQQVIDTTHENGGVVIVAHWFDDERKTLPHFIGMGVDGFENANQGTGLTYDRRVFKDIVEACAAHDLIMLGVADYHGYGSSCFTWNALEIPGWHQMDRDGQRESIMDLLRQRDMTRIRVLLYHDRHLFNWSPLLLSPLYNTIGYFRTLNALQLLSWLAWLVIICLIRHRFARRKERRATLSTLETLSLASALFLLVNGVMLWIKGLSLTGYNKIYHEYSTILLLCGAGFLIYTGIMVYFEIRKNKMNNVIKNNQR